uniref:Protein maelstrom n=1 Tax=Amblyomma aureolatum TaxID=187763 RepID=A0A1E1XGI7_9ACAR
MAPKKKGPFFFLMREIQNTRRERNLPCALEDVREEAGEKWKRLTERERARYEDMANEHKERGRGSLYNKFTSDGRCIALVLKEEDERVQLQRDMVTSIQQHVDDMGPLERVKKWPLYIVSTNILCEANGIHYPLEIAVIEYSIEQGFIRAFHRFINPGKIPLGFASAAKDHSENTHGIPITGFEEGITDYKQFVQDLFAFLHVATEDQCPPIFTMQDHIPQAEGCLRWIEEAADITIDIQIWDILPLLRKLRSVTGDEISQSEAEGILNCALFDYDMKSLCFYHAEIDNRHCALGESRRIAYKMSNALLNAYKIETIIEYQHLPPRFDPSLNFEVSQMNVRPVRPGLGRRMQPVAGAGDEGIPRDNYVSAPLPREPRRPEDYYGDEMGPTVIPASARYGAASASASSVVDDQFPSLCESMQKCQPPSRGASGGMFSRASSSAASYSDKSETASMTLESSQHGGARPKSGVSSRLAAQFPEQASASPVMQGIGRGLVPAGSSAEGPQIPRQPRVPPPAYIQLRKPGDGASSKGAGRGGAF